MTWKFGKGSVVTTYLSLVHHVWSFIWEDLKGGSDLKVQSGIYRRLDNLHGWQTMMAEVQQIVYSFIHLSLFERSIKMIYRSISRSHVWRMTQAVSRNLSLGSQLEYLYVSFHVASLLPHSFVI